jgi:uncharacterized protein YndB with AHSA1/START domain
MCNYEVAGILEGRKECAVLERQVTLPASREDVWNALTDPTQVKTWFGADVEWELRPGGRARFSSLEEQRVRAGVVEAVTPAESLRYRWWPEDETEHEIEPASEVTYTLEDVPDGTRLTVTEQPLTPGASLASSRTPRGTASAAAGAWLCPWDFRVLALFVAVAARVSVCA